MPTVALVLGLALIAFAVITVVRALAAPARKGEVVEQIGVYGYDPSAPQEVADRSIEGIAQTIGGVFSLKSKQEREEELRAKFVAAGQYHATPRAFAARQLLFAVACLVLWIGVVLFGNTSGVISVFGLIVAPLFGWSLPSILLSRALKRRNGQIDRELPSLIDLLVVTVEAGIGFVGALRLATEQLEGPLAEEVRLALQEQNMGRSTSEAIERMAQRTNTPGTRSFARAIIQGETLGVSIGQILRNLADELRKKRKARAEEQAQKAPVKMLFPLIFLIFPAMFVILLLPAVISISHALSS